MLGVDFAALEGQYPAVTTDLAAVGLTAHQYTAIRLALVTALLAETLHDVWQDPQGATGTLGQNMTFVKAHPQLIDQLQGAGLFAWP